MPTFSNPFKKKEPAPGRVAAVPDVEIGELEQPGLLLQSQPRSAPAAKPASKSGAGSSKQAAVPAAAAAPEEQPTGLLGKFSRKKKSAAVEEEAEDHPRTLKERFKDQKAAAGIGLLMSILLLVLAMFSGGMYKILNIVCGGAGIVCCLFYFFASNINKGTRIFFGSALLVVLVALGSFIYNIVWLVTNFTSLTSWL